MNEQRPHACIGQEVTVYYRTNPDTHTGTLEAVTKDGFIVSSLQKDQEETTFYPFDRLPRLPPNGTQRTPTGASRTAEAKAATSRADDPDHGGNSGGANAGAPGEWVTIEAVLTEEDAIALADAETLIAQEFGPCQTTAGSQPARLSPPS